jgi:putative flippase GtrA
MEKIKETSLFLYRHHFIRYLLVGGTTFIIDLSLLYVLHGRLEVNLEVATSIAYWTSIAYNFSLNRHWTFSTREKTDLRRHLSNYLVLLAANYLFAVLFVSIASHHINYIVAKIISVTIQVPWTYYAYKHYIFTESSTSE